MFPSTPLIGERSPYLKRAINFRKKKFGAARLHRPAVQTCLDLVTRVLGNPSHVQEVEFSIAYF
jgi:hypothetical protein